MNKLSNPDLEVFKSLNMSNLETINKIFPCSINVPISVLIGCVKYHDLFKWVTESYTSVRLSKVYHDINVALLDLPADGILLYLPMLSIYLLFNDADTYKLYVNNIFNSEICYNSKIVQIVMMNNKHKFIISCADDEFLIATLKKVLRSDCEVAKNEDMVQLTFSNIFVSSREEEIKLFQKLKDKINHSSLSLLVVKDSLISQKRYIEADVSKFLEMKIDDQEKVNKKMMKRLDDIWYYLKSQPPVVNITINNNINQPTRSFKNVKDAREALISWINANSPVGKTMTDYYNACRGEVMVKSLHMGDLTKLVEELGYLANRKTKPYVWTEKSI